MAIVKLQLSATAETIDARSTGLMQRSLVHCTSGNATRTDAQARHSTASGGA